VVYNLSLVELNATGTQCSRWRIGERIQKKVLRFLTEEKYLKEVQLLSAIGFTDLAPELQKEVRNFQEGMAVEL